MNEQCHVDAVNKSPSEAERKETTVQMLAVRGMGCPNCAMRVRNSLISLNGVVDADVDHQTGFAYVLYNPRLTSPQDFISAVSGAGGDSRHEYSAQIVRS